ncbi:UvrD-helicase domain-containing protein [bacterium]|nr:UvrD-helicase domain-containing protein [bacterium]
MKILKEDIEGLGKKYDKNFSIIDTKDRDSLLREILKKLNLKDQFQEKEVSAFISKQKNAGFTARDFKSEATNDYEGSMVQIYEEYEKRMETSNTLDFDDLLLFPLILFKSRPDILEKWQNHFDYILVDEAQDTNGVQFELAKMLSRN